MRKWIIMLVMAAALCPAVWAEEPYPEEWGEVVDSAPMTVEEFRDTTPEEWLEKGVEVIRDSLRAPLRLSAGMITVLVVTSAVRSTSPSALSEGAASALDAVSAAVLFVLCAPAAEGLLNYAQEAFSSASQYLTAFVPVFAGVVAACGQVGTATVYSGLFFTAAMAVSQLFASCGMPFLRMLLALSAVSCMDGGVDADALSEQFAKWMKRALTAGATVFAALLGMQGLIAQSTDSFALKTGKLVVSSGIPVVGKVMSDALGAVLAGLHLMKATVGFAVIAVVAAAFVPILTQCAVYQMVFAVARIAAAALGARRAQRLFSGLGQTVGLCMAMCGLFGFMVLSATILMILLGGGG